MLITKCGIGAYASIPRAFTARLHALLFPVFLQSSLLDGILLNAGGLRLFRCLLISPWGCARRLRASFSRSSSYSSSLCAAESWRLRQNHLRPGGRNQREHRHLHNRRPKSPRPRRGHCHLLLRPAVRKFLFLRFYRVNGHMGGVYRSGHSLMGSVGENRASIL